MTQIISHTRCKKCKKIAHVVDMIRLPIAGHECSDRGPCTARQKKLNATAS